jgi:hypothetical protein
VAVFGRRGARPFTLEEMQLMYLSPITKQLFEVQDIRGRESLSCPPEDSNCLPLPEPIKQSAPKTTSPTAALSTETDDQLESEISARSIGTAAGQASAATLFGGIGLFVALKGWRTRRRRRRPRT